MLNQHGQHIGHIAYIKYIFYFIVNKLKMMIEKIKRYLLRHKEINFYKKNDSGSEYYRVGNSIIRVSDHVPTSNNQPDNLSIIVSGNNFVVMYGNKLINVNDYNEFKVFLKYHIKMCDCFKDLINKGLNRTSTDYIAREEKKPLITKTENSLEMVQIDGINMGIPTSGNYVFNRANFQPEQLKGLTEAQLNFLESHRMKSHESAKRYLTRIRKRIQNTK